MVEGLEGGGGGGTKGQVRAGENFQSRLSNQNHILFFFSLGAGVIFVVVVVRSLN